MKRPIEIGPVLDCPEQGHVFILFRNLQHPDGPAVLHITAPLTQDCDYKGPTEIIVEGRQTGGGFEITLGKEVVSALQPGLSLRLSVEGTVTEPEFLWLGDCPEATTPLHNVAQPGERNHDLLSEQLRVFAMAEDTATSALLQEAAPEKLGFSERRQSLKPRNTGVPANVAFALAAFLAGVILSSLVWLGDWRLSLADAPPQPDVAPLGPMVIARQELGQAIVDSCALNGMTQPARASLMVSNFYQASPPVLVRLCPSTALWFNNFLSTGLASALSPKDGGGKTSPQDELSPARTQTSAKFADHAAETGLGTEFRDSIGDVGRAPLPLSVARLNPLEGGELTSPPLEKPKVQKHAVKKSHFNIIKSAPMPPKRPEVQNASLFSQVSAYISRMLH